jgi:hypothetical protein
MSVPPDWPDSVIAGDVTTVRGKLLGSESTDRTPGDAIFRKVAVFAVYVMATAVGFPESADAPSDTVAVRPEEHTPAVTFPLAQ